MLLVAASFLLFGASEVRSVPRDSYLEAYEQSHGTAPKTDREYSEPFPYPPSQPEYHYGPPKYVYGPPAHSYGPPVVAVYGPPAPPEAHGMLGLLDKIKWKLDLFTLGKILLKVVLFKKFVSFVAVLCLLLFLPTLKHKVDEAVPEDGDDEDVMRGFAARRYKDGDEALNNITQFVIGAIDNFSKNYTDQAKCDNMYCMARKVVQKVNNKLSYRRLAEVYAREDE